MSLELKNVNNSGYTELRNLYNSGYFSLAFSGSEVPTTTTTTSTTSTTTTAPTTTTTTTTTTTSTTTTTTTVAPTTTTTTSTTTTTTTSGEVTLYSNFETYIVNGVRQATTTALIRTNISATRRLVVTDTITVTGFKFVRIPPSNWTTLAYTVTGTLTVVSGSGGTIDGGSSSKSFNTKSTVYNPTTGRANTTSQYDIYDVRPVNNSTTILTPGQYDITLLGTGANMDMAIMTSSLFPIDTTKKIYPSTTAATTYFAMQVF